MSTFRTNNASVSLQYNGTEWEQSGFSSPIYLTTVQPHNAAQLAHGQVHFGWNSSASQFDLCQSNGPGGLIVDGVMYQAPNDDCLALAQSATTSSALNYFYAVHTAGDVLSVSNAVLDPSGKILLTFSGVVLGNINDEVGISCFSIGGAAQANVSDAGTIVDANAIELATPPTAGLGTYTSGGICDILRLAASQTGHITGANGVQQESGDEHYTLVGMCYIGPSNSVNDTNTQRDCASWYNRGLKTCINELPGNQTTTSTSYTEISTGIECQFVTWGTGDPTSPSDLSWSISGMMGNSTAMDGVAATAGFDASVGTPPYEETGGLNPAAPVGGFPFSAAGSETGISEGEHTITLSGKAINGGTATYYGASPVATSLEIRIPQ
ncbi:MAG TPA: hypothetical protein VHX61_15025 [Rhizomicrobium sp.]|nr:hypothetical protein [Rhizomicrobium sp.]